MLLLNCRQCHFPSECRLVFGGRLLATGILDHFFGERMSSMSCTKGLCKFASDMTTLLKRASFLAVNALEKMMPKKYVKCQDF